jgi:dTDP-4-dehydrorhamnose 3,5-epimerase
MKVTKTDIDGLLIIEPDIYKDNRGHFFESYNKQKYAEIGIDKEFVQDNQSISHKGTIRGLHYQIGEYAQGKLVRVITGKIIDHAVDIRFGSPTFGKYVAIELSAENFKQFWIPVGFAHGFEVLEKNTILQYKCTNYYSQKDERGIIYNDKDINIKWETNNPIVSSKDQNLPSFKEISNDFMYYKEK